VTILWNAAFTMVEEESEIWNLQSEVKAWAFSGQQERPYVVTEN
jgi:hypothetical protein